MTTEVWIAKDSKGGWWVVVDDSGFPWQARKPTPYKTEKLARRAIARFNRRGKGRLRIMGDA